MEDIVQLQCKWIMSHFSVWIMKWVRNYVEISMKVRGNLKPKNMCKISLMEAKFRIGGRSWKQHFAVIQQLLSENSKTRKLKQLISRLTHIDVHHVKKNSLSAHIWKFRNGNCAVVFYQEVLCRSCANRTHCGLIWLIYLYAGLSLVVAFILDWRLYCSVFLLVLCSCLCH